MYFEFLKQRVPFAYINNGERLKNIILSITIPLTNTLNVKKVQDYSDKIQQEITNVVKSNIIIDKNHFLTKCFDLFKVFINSKYSETLFISDQSLFSSFYH